MSTDYIKFGPLARYCNFIHYMSKDHPKFEGIDLDIFKKVNHGFLYLGASTITGAFSFGTAIFSLNAAKWNIEHPDNYIAKDEVQENLRIFADAFKERYKFKRNAKTIANARYYTRYLLSNIITENDIGEALVSIDRALGDILASYQKCTAQWGEF